MPEQSTDDMACESTCSFIIHTGTGERMTRNSSADSHMSQSTFHYPTPPFDRLALGPLAMTLTDSRKHSNPNLPSTSSYCTPVRRIILTRGLML